MPKISKNNTTVLIVVACAALVLGIKYFSESKSDGFGKAVNARAKGNPGASVKVIEYVDFQCPACAQGAEYLKEFVHNHPDKLYVELKYFPLGMHRHAFVASRYAECAARQNKFWPFTNEVFGTQKDWHHERTAEPRFREIAQKAEVNMSKFDVCLQDPKINEIILEEKKKGEKLQIRSTPTYFINGNMVVGTKSLKAELKKLTGI